MWKWYFALLLVILPAQSNAQVVFTISDYPRYGTALDTTQRKGLRKFARAVVGALITGQDVTITVNGHADFDAQGHDFEMKVSTEKAQAAEQALRSLLNEEGAKAGVSSQRLQSVSLLSVGNGTSRPIFPHPKTLDERKANRRVDFVTTTILPQPPVQQSVFERCRKAIGLGATPGVTRRLTCACNKLEQQSPRAQDSTYDFRASRNIPGSAGFPNMTPAQWDLAIRSIVRHYRQDLSSASSNSPTDKDFNTALQAIDDSVGRSISDFAAQENAGAAQGIFDRIALNDIRARMADPQHIYSCYAGYSRQTHDQ